MVATGSIGSVGASLLCWALGVGTGSIALVSTGVVSAARMVGFLTGQSGPMCPGWRHLKQSFSLMHRSLSSGISLFSLGLLLVPCAGVAWEDWFCPFVLGLFARCDGVSSSLRTAWISHSALSIWEALVYQPAKVVGRLPVLAMLRMRFGWRPRR